MKTPAAQSGQTKSPFIDILDFRTPTAPVGGIWCSECEHETEERDPYGTGDPWYVVKDCELASCPYGKTEMDQE